MLVLLSGCSGVFTPPITPPCPETVTLNEASTITRFMDGPGRDLIDIDFEGEITKLSGKCFYEMDYDTGEGVVRVEAIPEFKIERGAANQTHRAEFEYFISILDGGGRVIDKQRFPFTAKYWTNRNQVTERDAPVELTIPLTGGLTGQDFTIYLGFQLSREELEYNRSKTRH